MAPFWDPDAGGAVVGLRTGHGRAHYWRAMLESVALDCAMGYAAIDELTGEPVRELLTMGGGARSRLMRQIVADSSGRTVLISSTLEASCLGAAMLAAAGAGWYATPVAAAHAMQGTVTHIVEPTARNLGAYAELLAIYRELYPALRATFARLADYRARDLR